MYTFRERGRDSSRVIKQKKGWWLIKVVVVGSSEVPCLFACSIAPEVQSLFHLNSALP